MTASLAASCALAALRASAGARTTLAATRRIPVVPGSGEKPVDPDAD
jgi:hypothetical protein